LDGTDATPHGPAASEAAEREQLRVARSDSRQWRTRCPRTRRARGHRRM